MFGKRIFYSIILSLFAAVACFCSKHEAEFVKKTDSDAVLLSVSEARQYVESLLRTGTRSADTANDNPLVLGNFSMDWEQSESSVGDILYSLDIPVNSEYKYYSVGFDSLDNYLFTPIYHKMVVVKEGLTETLDAYLRFYIPDREHTLSHSESYYDALLNSDVKTEFTGMSVYSTLDGFPVAAGRYSDGVLEESAFLFDTLRPIAENAARLARLLDGRLAARVRNVSGGSTRAQTGSDYGKSEGLVDIDAVEIVGYRPIKPKIEFHHNFEDIRWNCLNDPLADDGFGRGGGGGGGSSAGSNGEGPDDGKKYPKNPRIETDDPNICEDLDEFLKDCMGQILVGSLNVNVQIIPNSPGCKQETIYNMIGGQLASQKFTIYLSSNYRDYAFMEELIHVHQKINKTKEWANQHKLNNEIEAKLGWVLYLNRQNKGDNISIDWALGGRDGRDIFLELANCFIQKGSNNDEFYDLYGQTVSFLRKVKAYSDETKYPFDQNYKQTDTLMKLMEDCLKKQ